MKSISPAKIIISGEHSVVYGAPALAMAVNRYAVVNFEHWEVNRFCFNLPGLNYFQEFSNLALLQLKNEIDSRYNKYLAGEISIREVLHEPAELLVYTCAYFIDKFSVGDTTGIYVAAFTDFPIGVGMGSSAALIVSLLQALAQHYSIELTKENYFEFGREIENLQHGRSSGLDVYLAVNDGCVLFNNGKFEKRDLPTIRYRLINTGIPDCSTGECVSHVAKIMNDKVLLADFASVTLDIDQALRENSLSELQRLVKVNHNLLCRIGVVPKKVERFIADLENLGFAAKICGAGAVIGDKAGIMMVVGDGEVMNYELLVMS